MTGGSRWLRWSWIVCLAWLFLSPRGRGEDADRPRGYLHFRSGEFNTLWEVHDLWGLSLGLNFNRNWGAELAGDTFEHYDSIGEMSVHSILPQARFRHPLFQNRFVPYVLAGVGPVFMQFNDAHGDGRGKKIEGEGWRVGATVGLGLEYFLGDSISFVTEGKYVWVDPMPITVDGREESFEASTFLATIGLRVYFDENRPRPLAEQEEKVATRFSFGARYGWGMLVDSSIGSGLTLEPEGSAYGDFNQTPGMLLGVNFGENWGVDLHLNHLEPRLALNGKTLGEYSVFSALPMLRLRAPLQGGRWVPYLTAGVGAVYGEFNDGRGVVNTRGKGVYPAAVLGSGVEYFVHRNFSLSADTWWQTTWGHEFQVGTTDIRGNFSSFHIQLGFRAYLGEIKR